MVPLYNCIIVNKRVPTNEEANSDTGVVNYFYERAGIQLRD